MEIFNFHKSKLQDNPTSQPLFTCNLFKTLSNRDISILDALFSLDEIKEAICNYGRSKAPDAPDTRDYVLHNSRIFSVSSMRKWIDATLSPDSNNVSRIRWNRLLLIKVNIHSWRLGLDRLPTRCNLNARGIEIDSTHCPVCNEGQETSCQLFIECPVAVGLWNMVSAWWSCGDFPKDIHSLLVWGDNVNFSNTLKSCFDVVIQTTTWIIWRYRNRICFDLKPPRNDTLGEEIKVLSHCWILHGNRKLNPLWLDWVFDPIKACKNSL
ncbi:RNA-directed DNA polymerase, eukaryota, reverse transcriptase zinc-binding domain protein [Tanacetum coccineum]